MGGTNLFHWLKIVHGRYQLISLAKDCPWAVPTYFTGKGLSMGGTSLFHWLRIVHGQYQLISLAKDCPWAVPTYFTG